MLIQVFCQGSSSYKEKLRFRPGIVLEKKTTDLKTFSAGLNIIATHGLLKSYKIIYYGIEANYTQFQRNQFIYQGFKFGLTYQQVRNYFGFNINNSFQIIEKNAFWYPEIGFSFLGIISLNYGYFIPLNSDINLNQINPNINLKLSLNISYGEILNMVGTSDKKW